METTQQKELPLEVLWGIFKYLDLKTLLDVCPYVSRSWNKAAMHDVFWAQVYARIWGHTNGQGEKALPPPPTANETAASTNSRHNHHNNHHYEDLLSVSDNSDSDDSDEDSDNFSDVDSDDGIASAGDVEMAEGSDNDDVINDVINSQPNSKISLPLCSCSSTHHAGGSPICPSWRGSVIARLRCERVVGGRSGRWDSHALVPSALACEATSDADDDDDNDNNNSSNSSGKEAAPGSSGENENARRQGRYRNQQRDAALRDFDKLRDGVVDMATWAAKKLPFVPVDFCPGLELMLNSNSDDVARVRDPQVAPFDWVSREAFCGREHVSEPEAILGTALEVVSLAECRFPGLAKAFAGAFRRAVQPVLAVLKLRYRSGSAKYLDGLVTRTLALLRDSELDGRDKVYAMFYSALLCFEYGRYLIETRFDIDYHAKIIRMSKKRKKNNINYIFTITSKHQTHALYLFLLNRGH